MATSINLDDDMKSRVRHLAGLRHRSAHAIMREAIEQYVEREERREALRQDAINAWNEYRASGRHATQEEADAWLTKLAAGEGVKPPECHG